MKTTYHERVVTRVPGTANEWQLGELGPGYDDPSTILNEISPHEVCVYLYCIVGDDISRDRYFVIVTREEKEQ